MKLSEQTMAVIKNFAKINPNFLITPGNKISTINASKSIMANATIEENFPVMCGIYDLNQLIGVLENFEEPELEFGDECVQVRDKKGAYINYYYTDPRLLVHNKKNIVFPAVDFSFKISAADFKQIRKASSTLGVKELMMDSHDYNEPWGALKVYDSSNATKHQFSVQIALLLFNVDLAPFRFILSMDLINKLMPIDGDYLFEISGKKLSRIRDSNNILEYFIALNTDSYFGKTEE